MICNITGFILFHGLIFEKSSPFSVPGIFKESKIIADCKILISFVPNIYF